MKTYFSILMCAAILAGCAPRYQEQPMPILTPPVIEEQNPESNPGSLFDANRSEFLFEDNRAKRVGDIVLVNVDEVSSTRIKAETKAKKDNKNSMAVTAYPKHGLLGNLPLAKELGAETGMNIGATTLNDLKSNGETKNESEFTATVATRIVRRLPGNILQVEGARRIRVNHETQFLVVRGLIRQRDIGSDNSISSSNLAEAQIEVYGQGVLTDKQRPGWLSRLLDNIYPF
ncbi:flagellar basal body L-ring protein FlgH [Pseudodesulfovibrio tunisiensis]|uniref:flagellar basal body L-ring protein FlgH n=1 Tax=Pseudodesulfovibrio tunisiensis TaxID=463192 RepID=UPI001FB2910E|nr:flagellar basal body L-ring protein FlgH [Pseudodesulfovibrio tunisiensis]